MRDTMASPAPAYGSRFGRYRIIETIGSGGMGVVYRARDERLERDVAVKLLASGVLADNKAREQFRREALALSRLNHPNIATVFDFDTQDGIDFLVTEFIPGISLDQRIAWALIAMVEILDVARQLATGLAHVHENGLVHGDLKPANLRLTTRGLLKILDFGLARLSPQFDITVSTVSTSESGPPSFSGTVPYLSPERLRGELPSPCSDMWSVGVVLYELATNKRPFDESSYPALIDAILNKEPIPPGFLIPAIPPDLNSVILKALTKDPALRYQHAKDLIADLDAMERGIPTSASGSHGAKQVASEPRVLEAAAPRESAVGKSTEIVTMVRREGSGGLREYLRVEAVPLLEPEHVRERPFEMEFPRGPRGSLQPADICLRLDSPDFEPRSQTKKLKVPPLGDSEPCTFLLVPRIPGDLVVNLELLNQQEQVVASRPIRTRALEATSVPDKIVVSIPLVLFVRESVKRVFDETKLTPTMLMVPAVEPIETPDADGLFSSTQTAEQPAAREPEPTHMEAENFSDVSATPRRTLLSRSRAMVGASLVAVAALAMGYFAVETGFRRSAPPLATAPTQKAENHGDASPQPSSEVRFAPANGTPASEENAILDLTKRYVAAYNSRDLDAERSVWPNMPAERIKAETMMSKSLSSVRLSFQCDYPQISEQFAALSCIQTTTAVPKSGEARKYSAHIVIFFGKSGGNWVISDIQPRKS